MPNKRRTPHEHGDDLFSGLSGDPAEFIRFGLSRLSWPPQGRFPVNHAQAHVRDVVRVDLECSDAPLLIAGYSAIASLVELVASWRQSRGSRVGSVRLLLGTEPFPSSRAYFGSAQEEFTQEIRDYWLERSVSVRLSAKVIRVIQELDTGSLQVRTMPGPAPLHAKIYISDNAATVGSSNYTHNGMVRQLEANARFEKAGEKERYTELVSVAENLWSHGMPWEEQFRRLLLDLLQVVGWQEALARACAELLEGDWARHVLAHQEQRAQLWPAQRAGIAQALWVLENLGSVLIADATGSGKTRMGAHLVAAVRDQLIDTGRLRRDRDLTTLVCPPAVLDTWQSEALISGVTIMPISHGLLSRPDPGGPRIETGHVTRAQVLAIDEAHNFLSQKSNRTRQVQDSIADHVLLFTATPISRGAQDLLTLVGLLGADNFDDDTLTILDRLDYAPATSDPLTGEQRDRLRREIQRFTVRRTKSAFNELVTRDEAAYRHQETGRICRYPLHEPHAYQTGETAPDERIAKRIREASTGLRGIIQLGRTIRVPDTLKGEVTDQAWLEGRLKAANGLARHHVLAAMRSSRAALVEHLAGTNAALDRYELPPSAKAQASGDVIQTVTDLAQEGPPQVELDCALPDWLAGEAAWHDACAVEEVIYQQILALSRELSNARERTKAALLEKLARGHRLVLAFDRHPISLAAINAEFRSGSSVEILIATGGLTKSRRRVRQIFAPASQERAIALCSDALNEGLNLQGASALIHLDLPTTLRVAEQRVGRVDRMDSPHDSISVWWPEDGPAFATREIELLLARRAASESLLGSNLPMPTFSGHEEDTVIQVHEQVQDLDQPDIPWDGIRDALDPVRRLVHGEDALISPEIYAEHKHTRHRVIARVAPVAASIPWAFLALSGTQHGAPRWLILEGEPPVATVGVEAVAERLRVHLSSDPPNVAFDERCERLLDRFLTAAGNVETMLLPRRMQRALDQMADMARIWGNQAGRDDWELFEQWQRVRHFAHPEAGDDDRLDPYLVGEMWWDLVRPRFADLRSRRRRRRYTRLRDLDFLLADNPVELATIRERLRRIPVIEPVDKRVSAVIIGVPAMSTFLAHQTSREHRS
jgi:hypothetical protein